MFGNKSKRVSVLGVPQLSCEVGVVGGCNVFPFLAVFCLPQQANVQVGSEQVSECSCGSRLPLLLYCVVPDQEIYTTNCNQ